LHSIEQNVETPLFIEDYAKAVLNCLTFLNIEKADFICHSFGGRVVFKINQINPFIINKLVLIDVAGIKPKLTIKKFIKKIVYKSYKFLGVKNLDKFFSSDYLSMSSLHKQTFKNIVNEHFDSYISEIKKPTLIIYGSLDKDTPLYMAQYLHKKIENSKLEIIKNAGHFCYLTNNNVVLLAQFFLN